jgi:hypothetical protein
MLQEQGNERVFEFNDYERNTPENTVNAVKRFKTVGDIRNAY